ncbi:MAG: alpha/beta fold hydrolase [Gemmatimonadetes bacterium]|nr:alpha/beta fold hydrolase [Gemmatimonadota bacterium]
MDLHVRTAGSADDGTIVFVHGFPFDGSIWDLQLEALPPGWRGIAPDLRGFGLSPLGVGDLPSGRKGGAGVAYPEEVVLTMDAAAEDVAELIERYSEGPAVVCGMSMGGYVTFALLRQRPELVRGVILMDTRPGPDNDEGRENRRRMASTVRTDGSTPIASAMLGSLVSDATRKRHPQVVEKLRTIMEGTAPETIVAALAGMAARHDFTPELPGLSVPALVIVGAEDSITPPDQARAMAAALPQARLEIVDGAAHLPGLENAPVVNRLISDFLDTL